MTAIVTTRELERDPGHSDASAGVRIDAAGVACRTARGRRILRDVDLTIRPGEVVALVGASGAGKTTLLEILAGVRTPHDGSVRYDGVDLYANLAAFRSHLGYVPQDDIIHRELSVRATLHHAARLRLDPALGRAAIEARVDETLATLDLDGRSDVPVAALSGGQRKRASIAVELLALPTVFFLDEPTSGLDPATARGLLRALRRLAGSGSTIVLSTHNPSDVALCDRVVVLARDGYLAFAGSPAEALEYFAVHSFDEVYERLDGETTSGEWSLRFRACLPEPPPATEGDVPTPVTRPGAVRQWVALTRRNLDTLLHNRLTLAILVGSPALVVAMFALLFRPGAFATGVPALDAADPNAAVMIMFWVAFAAFFFGLTYGLLMVCTEMAIVRRERLVDLNLAAYVASKVTLLVPLLALVVATMLGVLRTYGQLPRAGWHVYGSLFTTLMLVATAALAIGLLTSAAVSAPEQATIALPMLCFPQVLFSGAVVSVPKMAAVGSGVSFAMADRWAFEAMGKALSVDRLWAEHDSLGPAFTAQFRGTFSGTVTTHWAIMGATAVLFLVACWAVLVRKCRSVAR